MKKITDKQRIDWLEEQFGCGLVSDDNGHWAVSISGLQEVPEGKNPKTIGAYFIVFKKEWANSVREAIDIKMNEV